MIKTVFTTALVLVLLLANYFVNWSDAFSKMEVIPEEYQLDFKKDDFRVKRYDASINESQLYKRKNIFNYEKNKVIKSKTIITQPKVIKKNEISEFDKKKKAYETELKDIELLGVIKKSSQLYALVRYKEETKIVQKNGTFRDVFFISNIGVDTIELTNNTFQIFKIIIIASE